MILNDNRFVNNFIKILPFLTFKFIILRFITSYAFHPLTPSYGAFFLQNLPSIPITSTEIFFTLRPHYNAELRDCHLLDSSILQTCRQTPTYRRGMMLPSSGIEVSRFNPEDEAGSAQSKL
jgi:hypothetical protein